MPGMELSLSCVSFALQNTGTNLPATVQVGWTAMVVLNHLVLT